MESIPLTNNQNAQPQATVAQTDVQNTSSRPVPVQIQTSPEGDSIILNGTEYNLKLVNAQQRQTLLATRQFLLMQNTNASSASPPTALNATNQLLALASPIVLKVPDAIINLAQQNGITSAQLESLAARVQGYPLPNVTIVNKEFHFTNGTVAAQNPGAQLTQGEFLAKISLQQGRPILLLTPIQGKLEIAIGAPVNETQIPINKLPSDIVIAKIEPVQIMASFLKKLEALPPSSEPTKSDPTKNTSKVEANTIDVGKLVHNISSSGKGVGTQGSDAKADISTKVVDVLQKAFNKTGALPIEASHFNSRSNLASELFKHMPHLGLPPLSQLNDLDFLKTNILGLASLNLASSQINPNSPFINASAISSLFQLILGFTANNNSVSMSKKLADYLEQLQSKVGLSTKQLGQLGKAGGLEAMAQFAANLHLYPQASTDTTGNLVWFFALPYNINQRHEQLEGKFEQGTDPDNAEKKSGWRLQLKFNLAQGPLLIAAQHQEQKLDIQFQGNNQILLDKVSNYLIPLSQKLTQLGFTTGELTTQIAQVPATLLPGDHFLVKTKA
ncbi:hypothetical protein [Shewanella morhuae]|uniref:Flagellar hook-length control protein FliK n=1 Tax=Shewanella morhuae TaxID=365591 RepID=A0A380A756_9GAMM|nr:hypothetical protein [Shewanella morhuae]SUI75529.1 Uncharacterised protein [Shewanella morhuae]